ncbi:hypothetical protein NLU14_08705 [Marinobacter sp. 71-i]|uniref:Uncharacterized protein n=1 Tax=Marinobacter iranensis TaxID=2962607 RepID=A0ABT5Y9I1_9GAMM|nr:hypothetical protein [Marinobacter iranensis]MDF0750309.1 hypothetical protein [Marinobacter iranensis]
MSSSKINILQSIKDNPKSTKALHDQFHAEFMDRAELSAFLGNLYRSGYIKKRTNGYWAMLARGEVLLQEMLGGAPDPEQEESEDPDIEPESKPEPTPAKVIAPAMRPAAVRGTSDRPAPAPPGRAAQQTNEAKMWAAIQAVQAAMDEGQKLIIEDSKTYFVFAARRFAIESEEDLAAAIRVAGMYAGVAA